MASPDAEKRNRQDSALPTAATTPGFWRRLWEFLGDLGNTHPACPICGRVYYVKTMPLHLSGHRPDDPDVIAWRERGAPRRA